MSSFLEYLLFNILQLIGHIIKFKNSTSYNCQVTSWATLQITKFNFSYETMIYSFKNYAGMHFQPNIFWWCKKAALL